METVTVNLGDRSYPILIGSGLYSSADLLTSYLGPGQVVVDLGAAPGAWSSIPPGPPSSAGSSSLRTSDEFGTHWSSD